MNRESKRFHVASPRWKVSWGSTFHRPAGHGNVRVFVNSLMRKFANLQIPTIMSGAILKYIRGVAPKSS